jgi:hypothetical protein
MNMEGAQLLAVGARQVFTGIICIDRTQFINLVHTAQQQHCQSFGRLNKRAVNAR